jgi:hypothetical protein
MRHRTLNCPTCRKWLTWVPLDGLTLQYRCDEHGLWTFTPLVEVAPDESLPVSDCPGPANLQSHDAA